MAHRNFSGPRNLVLESGLFEGVVYAKNPETGEICVLNIDRDRWVPLTHEEANDFAEKNRYLYLIPRQVE